ncbi:hypothetical protein KP509_05G011700 [Ceratopteris richardii]|uniref:Uncharacterized protein n=2 Tax=Ceratopteris richardii TaxID=49495 RepID=A0A8T2UJG5_CERRI|nr:hypothetical protein KP509_05G011700 [Ceratopteris richardii]
MDSQRRMKEATASPGQLAGKVAVITGAATGIGKATAELFVQRGAVVVIADVQDELCMQTAADLGHDKATFKHCDVSIETDVEDVIAFTVRTYGKLDIMFSNAGVWGRTIAKNVATVGMEDFTHVMSVNLHGMVHAIKHASKSMMECSIKGSIICTASVASTLGDGSIPIAYTTSKHATVGLMRGAASQLGMHGIRVNCISPGGTHTPLLHTLLNQFSNSLGFPPIESATLKDLLLSPSDVAKVVCFLASDDSAAINGANIVIDEAYFTLQLPM